MANEHWYVLKVRPGFERIAAQRLRKLNFAVFALERKITGSRKPHKEYPSAGNIYCQFDLKNRISVIRVPGVLDILGIPDPTPCDEDVAALQSGTRS